MDSNLPEGVRTEGYLLERSLDLNWKYLSLSLFSRSNCDLKKKYPIRPLTKAERISLKLNKIENLRIYLGFFLLFNS